MKIRLNWHEPEAIERFVAACPDATAAHRPAWMDILRAGLHHKPLSLTAWRDGQVVGYLPLALTRSMLFGRHLASLPYVNEAGVLAEDSHTAAVLIDEAQACGQAKRVRFVELRNRTAVALPALRAVRTDKKRMLLDLPSESDTLWQSLKAKVRNQVRKADRYDLDIRFGGAELLDAFYRVFAVNMRDLGTPVFPRRLFAAMLEHLGEDCELCVVQHEQRPIAGAVLVYHRQTTEVPSASALRQFNHTCANMRMYWALLERAIARGSTEFDFGRSSEDCGTYKFKAQWGAVAHDTGWQHIAPASDAKPITKEDDRFGAAIEVWKRLPVWLTRLAGPAIVRGIP
jgi:serine/alanine adding enzyme